VARRFGREGHPVGLVARNAERLAGEVERLRGAGVEAAAAVADARDPSAVGRALDQLEAALGAPGALCVSPLPDLATIKPVAQTTAEDLRAALELGVVGTAAAVTHVLPAMRAAGRGTLLFTTGSAVLNPNPERATSGVVNAAQATYFRMLHESLAGDGIYALHAVIVGAIGGDGHDPDAIADRMWQAAAARTEQRIVIER
jgi:NADP-dependent 3-hydroxy acid dehydrogenase YdfG